MKVFDLHVCFVCITAEHKVVHCIGLRFIGVLHICHISIYTGIIHIFLISQLLNRLYVFLSTFMYIYVCIFEF